MNVRIHTYTYRTDILLGAFWTFFGVIALISKKHRLDWSDWVYLIAGPLMLINGLLPYAYLDNEKIVVRRVIFSSRKILLKDISSFDRMPSDKWYQSKGVFIIREISGRKTNLQPSKPEKVFQILSDQIQHSANGSTSEHRAPVTQHSSFSE